MTSWKEGDTDTFYFDKILVKGSDIVDLEILSDSNSRPPLIQTEKISSKKEPFSSYISSASSVAVPRTVDPILAFSTKQSIPVLEQTVAVKKPTGNDFGSYFKPTSVLTHPKQKIPVLTDKPSASIAQSGDSLPPPSFVMQQTFIKEPANTELNTSINFHPPPGFSRESPKFVATSPLMFASSTTSSKRGLSLEELERNLFSSSSKAVTAATILPIPTKASSSHAPFLIGDGFKDLDLDSLNPISTSKGFSSVQDKISNSPHLVSKGRVPVGASSTIKSSYPYKNEPSAAFSAVNYTWKDVDSETKTKKVIDIEATDTQVDKRKLFDELKSSKQASKTEIVQPTIFKPLVKPTNLSSSLEASVENKSVFAQDLDDFYTPEGARVPSLTLLKLAQILKYATVKWGPNTVQMIENVSRSILELLQKEYSLIFNPRTDGSPSNGAVLIITGEHRLGAITAGISRQLVNRGIPVIVWITENRKIGLDISLNEQNSEKRYFDFQVEIASRHQVKFVKAMRELEEEPAYLKKSFSLIIDATAILDTDTNISTRKTSAFTFSEPLLPPELASYILALRCHKVALHLPSSNELRASNCNIISIILPTVNLMQQIKDLYQSSDNKLTLESLPRIFCVDAGISPYLLKKYDILKDNASISLESKDHDIYREVISTLYLTTSYKEIFYRKQ